MRGGEGAGLGAGTLAMIGQVEEPPDLVDREPKGAGPTDEREPLEVSCLVATVTADAAARRGKSPTRS
jgi:hypothetical protein